MGNTKIEWCNKVYNPITGCSPISEGCRNCYARRMANRLKGRYGYPKRDPFKVTFHPDRLEEPLHWNNPSRIFVCSMGDWMHPDVSTRWIDQILEVMTACPQHIFLTLTKRPENFDAKLYGATIDHGCRELGGGDYLSNLWLGVTAENQRTADERIPILLNTLAARRFISIEPMLGPIDLRWIDIQKRLNVIEIHWVICGGETGPGARPLHPDWVRALRDQCQSANVPFFFKHWSTASPQLDGKSHQGRMLDDLEWNEFPRVDREVKTK